MERAGRHPGSEGKRKAERNTNVKGEAFNLATRSIPMAKESTASILLQKHPKTSTEDLPARITFHSSMPTKKRHQSEKGSPDLP